MANPSKFTVPPAPVTSPLMLKDGLITSQPWLAWLNKIVWPILTGVMNGEFSPDSLLLSRQALPTDADAGTGISIPASYPHAVQDDSFPPQTQRTVEASDLSMLAASQFGRQLLPQVIVDTRANRANYPASLFPGALFVASDWLITDRSDGANWIYTDGEYDAALANLPGALTANDAGFKFGVTDYKHVLRWTGAAWDFTYSDPGSGFVLEGKPDGSAPNGGFWGLCDGSTYAVLKGDGTTQNIATVNRTNDSFPEGSTTFGAKAASRAKWEAAAVTDDESAHTHQVDPPNTTSTVDSGAGTVVAAGVGTTVATHTHTHDTDIAGFASAAGSAHHHTLSDASAQLKVPSEANGGLPARVGVAYFIRR